MKPRKWPNGRDGLCWRIAHTNKKGKKVGKAKTTFECFRENRKNMGDILFITKCIQLLPLDSRKHYSHPLGYSLDQWRTSTIFFFSWFFVDMCKKAITFFVWKSRCSFFFFCLRLFSWRHYRRKTKCYTFKPLKTKNGR